MKRVRAAFERKLIRLRPRNCQIEKVIELSAAEYSRFLAQLDDDQQFICENRDLMYQDEEGITHCMLVMGEGQDDGVLAVSEGYDYARYAAHMPAARQYVQIERYPSLSLYQQQMIEIVERCVEPLLKRQENGAAELRLSEARQKTTLAEFPLKLFMGMLADRPEFDQVCLDYDTVEVTINENYIHEDVENNMRM